MEHVSYFVWLPLSEEASADRIVKGLMDSNISVSTAEPVCSFQSAPQAIRIVLGSVSMDNLRTSIGKVREVYRKWYLTY